MNNGYPETFEVTVCPTLYWEQNGVEFVIFKIDEQRFRSQFFYSVLEQFGTGRDFRQIRRGPELNHRL